MMYIKFLLSLLLFTFLFFACDKEDNKPLSCFEEYLTKNQMVKYKEQEIGCKTYLALYEFEGKEYYKFHNQCGYIVSYPTDCEGTRLCEDLESALCEQFHETAVFKGIVGIEK